MKKASPDRNLEGTMKHKNEDVGRPLNKCMFIFRAPHGPLN